MSRVGRVPGDVWPGATGVFGQYLIAAIFTVIITAASAFGATPAQVTPSQVTPRTVAPPAPAGQPPTVNSQAAATQAPPGSEKVPIEIGSVETEGGFPDLAEETARLTEPFKGQTRTVADLYVLAAAVEQAYAKAGYILVRVIVPPQKIEKGGTFHLKVIDGFVEAVDVEHVPDSVRETIRGLLEPLIGQRHLRLAVIERALTLASAVPGATLRSALARGDQPGGTKLVIEAQYALFSGQVSVDNRLGPSFADWELTAQASLNSALGLGEQLYVYLSGDPDLAKAFSSNARRRVAGGGFTIPLGNDGLTTTVEGTISDTKPFIKGAFFQTTGLFKRLDARLSYPLIKTRSETLTLGSSFEYSEQIEKMPFFAVTLDEDRLNVVRLSIDWAKPLDEVSSLDAYFELSKGLTLFGVRTMNDAASSGIGLSRAGASPNFIKLEAQASYSRQLFDGFGLLLRARGQWAPDAALPSSEIFSLDGVDALSPMTAGEVAADSGWTMRGELGYAGWPNLDWLQASPYVFAAFGQGFNKIHTTGQISHASAYGGGLHISSPTIGTPSLSVEAGHDDAGRGENRVMLSLGVHF